MLYCIVSRLELAKLKSIIREIDDSAFVAIENVHEVLGGGFRKRVIH
ncbi:MAG: YitT family protein [Firmicutes bacterium]|nr:MULTISPECIES: YitT family protein [Thermoanaerobacteraceae]NLG79252.1 YitT family protein [Bacillota bacterium]